MSMNIKKSGPLKGVIRVPGDKSISHRAVLIGSLAEGTTEIRGFLESDDCLSTLGCMRGMGIRIENAGGILRVFGKGLFGLSAPARDLDAGNSGTTMRLLSGILAGRGFPARMVGDASLSRRPMKRITSPLLRMGAGIRTEGEDGRAPLVFSERMPCAQKAAGRGAPLRGIRYESPVASAQVKSCVLFAGMYADTPTELTEPVLSRDHTERMLRQFGAVLQQSTSKRGALSVIYPEPDLAAQRIDVPGDISSAAYFLAAASLIDGSEILLENVGVNPTRDGILRVLTAMGAQIKTENLSACADGAGEPTADLLVKSSCLHGCEIGGSLIPTLIDELPIVAVLAAFADGETVIRDASELRVKETDRIRLIANHLRRMGADCEELPDGLVIRGGRPLRGCDVRPEGDHRIAMAFSVAGLLTGGMTVTDNQCVSVSYPGFYRDLETLGA